MATRLGSSTRALLDSAMSQVRDLSSRSSMWMGGKIAYTRLPNKSQTGRPRQSVTSTTCGDASAPLVDGAKLLTLVIVVRGGEVLLGRKKRGFGSGYFNGFGGKVETGELVARAAHRELWEECGIRCDRLEKKGIVWFMYQDGNQAREVHVFVTSGSIQGSPFETEEMEPVWFDACGIPYENMWAGDRYWLPVLLQGRCFKGVFSFEGPKKLAAFRVHQMDELHESPLEDWSMDEVLEGS